MNAFQEFLALQPILSSYNSLQFEERSYLDGDDNVEYYAITFVPNALESDTVWMIYKNAWGGTSTDVKTRQQLPDDGTGFKYAASLRASYFS